MRLLSRACPSRTGSVLIFFFSHRTSAVSASLIYPFTLMLAPAPTSIPVGEPQMPCCLGDPASRILVNLFFRGLKPVSHTVLVRQFSFSFFANNVLLASSQQVTVNTPTGPYSSPLFFVLLADLLPPS